MHILAILRLATVKAQDKLQALVNAEGLDELTIVRARPVHLEKTAVQVNQVTYAPHLPDELHDFTPLMRLNNHRMIFLSAYRAIKHFKPDVVYGIFLVPYGLFAWILAKWFRKKCLLTLIGTDLNDYTLRRFTSPFFKWMLRHVDLITVVDEDSRQRLLENTQVEPERVVILPNAVDLTLYLTENQSPKDLDAVYVGRLIDMKEPENLIESWWHVVRKRPNSRLAIVGEGVLRPELEAMTARLGLQNNILFTGWVEDVPYWVHRSRIFVSVSSQEGVPMALIEAMAAGLVPIHTAVGGVPSILKDGENGFLVDYPTDTKQVAERVLWLLKDEELYFQMQAEAMKVRHNFGLSGVTEAWGAILQHPALRKNENPNGK
jgi:glycosyltransferase involved in cell wall biosynthesis